MHGGLDQTRRRDRTGGSPGILIRRRGQHLDRDQLRRTLAVPRDRPRKLPRHLDEARLKLLGLRGAGPDRFVARGAIGKDQEAVVGRAVAVDCDLVEASVGDRPDKPGDQTGLHRRVGGDVSQQGRHVRVDHARALAHPSDAHGRAGDFELCLRRFRLRVGCHDRPRRRSTRIWAQLAARFGDAGLDRVHRQVAADHACGAHQHLIRVEVEPVGGQLRHEEGVAKTLRSSARVCVARVDRQRLHTVALQVKLVDHDRSGLHFVRREYAAGVARRRGVDHAKVVPLVAWDGRRPGRERLDATRRRASPKSSGVGHGHWSGPVSAVVRSNPNAMLKHSTPWPDAPLIRLSRAAVTTALRP